MTEKRFKGFYVENIGWGISDCISHIDYLFETKGDVIEFLNVINNLNEDYVDEFNQSNCITVQKSVINDLKKENEELKYKYNEQSVEYEGLEEQVENLLDFKDKVFDLLNRKIEEYKKYDGYDTESYYIGTRLLKDLKKELRE